jgi:hypothetical protein
VHPGVRVALLEQAQRAGPAWGTHGHSERRRSALAASAHAQQQACTIRARAVLAYAGGVATYNPTATPAAGHARKRDQGLVCCVSPALT